MCVGTRRIVPSNSHVHETVECTPMVDSSYLRCSRMAVCRSPDGLIATSSSGGDLTLVRSASVDRWHMNVPTSLADLEELEDFLVLVLTTGWRCLDWIPLHAGALSRGGCCIIVCAPSGGGKSTLTAGLMRAGWRTLGDDKLLLRIVDGRPRLAAVLHSLNLHPRTRQWFPEVGDLWLLPAYSAWTEKRKGVHCTTFGRAGRNAMEFRRTSSACSANSDRSAIEFAAPRSGRDFSHARAANRRSH